MNKKNIINKLSCKTGIKKNIIQNIMEQFNLLLIDTLQKGEIINISGFGKFFTKQRNEREYISFQTGEKFVAPPKLYPVLKFSDKFVEKF